MTRKPANRTKINIRYERRKFTLPGRTKIVLGTMASQKHSFSDF